MLLLSALAAAAVALGAKPNVIPALREWTDNPERGTYTLSATSRIVVEQNAPAELVQYAETFGREIGRPVVRVKAGQAGKMKLGDIRLCVNPAAKATPSPEGYTLSAGKAGVVIEASTALGAFWGTRSLLQVFAETGNSFPGGVAKDWPEFKVRGFMFDCGRKPFTLTTLRQIIRICAYYKLNECQLHLSDNYIWLHNYPGAKTAMDVLTYEPSPGAFRLESKIPGLTSRDISYTKADFLALVAEAAAQGVKVVPELDVPGHALQMVRVRPDLMYKGTVGAKHDIERAAMLDLSNPETFPFITSIYDEYIDGGLFAGDIVHIGTDEYYGDAESYRKFADEMLKYIKGKGKTPRLWGSLSYKRGKTPVTADGVQMNIWSLGWQRPKEAIDAGYDIINILDGWTYSVPSGNGSIGGYGDDINSEAIYNAWTPATFGKESVALTEPRLIGGYWAIWNDNSFLTDPGLCGRDLLPRIQKNCAAIAAKCWDPAKPEVPYADFLAQVKRQAPALEATEPAAWSRTFTVLVPAGSRCFPLAMSDETDLYAVSPLNGKVGFRREGAHYTFDATLPVGRPVKLTFHSKDRQTWIEIDGVKVEGKPQRQHFADACKFFTLPEPTEAKH